MTTGVTINDRLNICTEPWYPSSWKAIFSLAYQRGLKKKKGWVTRRHRRSHPSSSAGGNLLNTIDLSLMVSFSFFSLSLPHLLFILHKSSNRLEKATNHCSSHCWTSQHLSPMHRTGKRNPIDSTRWLLPRERAMFFLPHAHLLSRHASSSFRIEVEIFVEVHRQLLWNDWYRSPALLSFISRLSSCVCVWMRLEETKKISVIVNG